MDTLDRCAKPKPARGEHRREKIRRTLDREAHEREQKAIVRARDNHRCRWPRCHYAARFNPLEIAHVLDKSKGGTSDSENLIALCKEHHQGAQSLHSKDLQVVPVYERLGTNGPCHFLVRSESGMFLIVATERTIGVSIARGA